jgi:hypothetical protein
VLELNEHVDVSKLRELKLDPNIDPETDDLAGYDVDVQLAGNARNPKEIAALRRHRLIES